MDPDPYSSIRSVQVLCVPHVLMTPPERSAQTADISLPPVLELGEG